MARLKQLTTEEKIFDSIDSSWGKFKNTMQREKMLADFIALKRLTLRVGAQVMMIKNCDETLVNGSMGRVLRFEQGYPVVEFFLRDGIKRKIRVEPEIWEDKMPVIPVTWVRLRNGKLGKKMVGVSREQVDLPL